MPGIRKRVKDAIFGLLYVMRDGAGKSSKPSSPDNGLRNTILIFMIDLGQVLRVMLQPSYGWSEETYNTAKWIDVVYIVTSLVNSVLPRYSLFVLAFVLVSVALADAFYCAKLFEAGDVNRIGPVRALRVLVGVVVTTLFSSVIKWLLIPLDCLVSDEESFSSYIHGPGHGCTPWGMPDILISIPCLALVVMYCLFALTASFLSLGTNPLSLGSGVSYTGRVEVQFLGSKIAATFLVFLAEHLTPVAISVILFLMSSKVFYNHLKVLPFVSPATNKIRGGVHGAITWLAMCNVIVASLNQTESADEQFVQTMQWFLLGTIPMAFFAAMLLVNFTSMETSMLLDRMKGEWRESQLQLADRSQGEGGEDSNNSYDDDKNSISHQLADPKLERAGAYEQFFDTSGDRKRAFNSSREAHTVARVLLGSRAEEDLPFLAHIVSRGLKEFPNCQELQVLRLSLLRFVFKLPEKAQEEGKKIEHDIKDMGLDLQYVLYSIERRAFEQTQAASNIGEGAFDAINLMEFDSGMTNAKEAHLKCLSELKKFWNVVSKKRKSSAEKVPEMVRCLYEFNGAVTRANKEYVSLLEKYPRSSQLLHSYSSFCDKVLNDPKEADERRQQAIVIEGSSNSEIADETLYEDDDKKSAATSEVSNVRMRAASVFNSWKHSIFGIETRRLGYLTTRVRLGILLLLAVAGASFGASQFWLFQQRAEREAHLINQTGKMRTFAISSLFSLRSMLLGSWTDDIASFEADRNRLADIGEEFQVQHRRNYEAAMVDDGVVSQIYRRRTFPINAPVGGTWQVQNYTYWWLGNDVAHRMTRAAAISMEKLADPDFSLETAGEEKVSMAYMNENSLRSILEIQQDIVRIYEDNVKKLERMSSTVVIATATANSVSVLLLAVVLIHGLYCIVARMQHMYMACELAFALPRSTCKKVSSFYSEAETALMAIDDEEIEKTLLMDASPEAQGENEQEEAVDDESGLADDKPSTRFENIELKASSVLPPRLSSLTENNIEYHTKVYESKRREDSRQAPCQEVDSTTNYRIASSMFLADASPDPCLEGEMPTRVQLDSAPEEEGSPCELDSNGFPELDPNDDNEFAELQAGPQSDVVLLAETQRVPDECASDAPKEPQNGKSEISPANEDQLEGCTDAASDRTNKQERDELANIKNTPQSQETDCDGNERPTPAVPLLSQPDSASTYRAEESVGAKGDYESAGVLRPPSSVRILPEPIETCDLAGSRSPEERSLRRISFTHDENKSGPSSPVESKHSDRSRRTDGETATAISLNGIDEETRLMIKESLKRHQNWVTSLWVNGVFLTLLLGIAVLNCTYPARRMNAVVQLAPTVNQAERRRFLVRSCVYLSRELVLDDGFSRLSKRDMTTTLVNYLTELKRVDHAIRLGGDLDIEDGADKRSKAHNRIMYMPGCPWRDDSSDCTLPERPGAASNGLQQLSISFFDAVNNVLSRYGDPAMLSTDRMLEPLRDLTAVERFDVVNANMDRIALLESDPDVPFIMTNFYGDLYRGYDGITDLFDRELLSIIQDAVHTNRLILITYVIFLLLVVYYWLFRRAMQLAKDESRKAKEFVSRIPSYMLSESENKSVQQFFGAHSK